MYPTGMWVVILMELTECVLSGGYRLFLLGHIPHPAPFATRFGGGWSFCGAHLGPATQKKASLAPGSHSLKPKGLGVPSGTLCHPLPHVLPASSAPLLLLRSSQTDPLSAHLTPNSPGMSHRSQLYCRCGTPASSFYTHQILPAHLGRFWRPSSAEGTSRHCAGMAPVLASPS